MKKNSEAPNVLIVEDDGGLARLIEKALRRDGAATAITTSGEEAMAWLNNNRADLMLLDLKLSDLHGKELIERLTAVGCEVPFIVITGHGDERVAVDMMKRGALDYIVKDAQFLELIPAVVRRSLAQIDREVRLTAAEVERKRLEQEILEISEHEMRRIGQDLHDGLYQVLASITILAEMQQASLAKSNAQDTEVASMISAQARQAIDQARMLARGLSPVDVETNGLMHALQEMVRHTTKMMKVQGEFHCDDPVLIQDHTIATHLYRIAQEAINNALKHGKAGRIDVALSKSDGSVELKITDNGTGFQPQSNGSGGMGMRNMQYRAEAIGARLAIQSGSQQGTEVICMFQQEQSPVAAPRISLTN